MPIYIRGQLVRTLAETRSEAGRAKPPAASKLAMRGPGHCREEDGRTSEADDAGRWIVGCDERFRGPETHRRIVSGNRNGSGPGGLDCGKAVMQGEWLSAARLNGEAKARAGAARGRKRCGPGVASPDRHRSVAPAAPC